MKYMAPVSRSSGLLAAEVGVAGGKMLAGWHIEGGAFIIARALFDGSCFCFFFSPEFREGLPAATCLHSSVCLKKSRLIVSVHQNRHVRIPQGFFFFFSLWQCAPMTSSAEFPLLVIPIAHPDSHPKKNPCIWILLIDLSSHSITRIRVKGRTDRLRIVSTVTVEALTNPSTAGIRI